MEPKKVRALKGATIAAIAMLAALTFLAWMCGYNFDHRNPDVGFATFIIFLGASIVFLMAFGMQR